jgi:hypothetical protein
VSVVIAPVLADDVTMQCIAGSEFSVPFTFYNDKAQTQLTNLTGYHARFHVRKLATDVTPLVNLTDTSPAGITLGGAAGTLMLLLADTQTLALPNGTYHWALQWQPPGHSWTTILKGQFNVDLGSAHD